jgi:hypothetical protein
MTRHSVRVPLRLGAVLPTLLLLPACGSSNYQMFVSVSPPEATVFINGEKVGHGDKHLYDLSFNDCGRIVIQATAPRFQPNEYKLYMFSREQLDAMRGKNVDEIHITLRDR